MTTFEYKFDRFCNKKPDFHARKKPGSIQLTSWAIGS